MVEQARARVRDAGRAGVEATLGDPRWLAGSDEQVAGGDRAAGAEGEYTDARRPPTSDA